MSEVTPPSVLMWFVARLAALDGQNAVDVLSVVRALRERQRRGDLEALPRGDIASMTRQAEARHEHHSMRSILLERISVVVGVVVTASASPAVFLGSSAWKVAAVLVFCVSVPLASVLYFRAQRHKLAAEELRRLVDALNDLCKPGQGAYRTGVRVPAMHVAENGAEELPLPGRLSEHEKESR